MKNSSVASASIQRSVGLWMAAGIALLQGFYAVWAFVDPQAVALYRGAPLDAGSAIAWAYAYGSRTLFIALVVALLLWRKDLATLKWVAILGLVMPVSDAWTALRSATPQADVVRHVLTAVYLVLTFAMLSETSQRGVEPKS